MEVHIKPLNTYKWEVPKCICRGLVYGLGGPWYEELTMHVCGMCRLAVVTFAIVGKRSS